MNTKLYKLKFDKLRGKYVAVSEIALTQGKSAGAAVGAVWSSTLAWWGEQFSRHLRPVTSGVLRAFAGLVGAAVLSGAAIGAGAAIAADLPTGGQIVAGQGAIQNSNNTTLTINQDSQKLITNWQSFNVGAGHTVIFNQPSSSSVALNRVLGNTRSDIAGTIQANGQVYLLNPNGILFSKTSQVNVGSLVAGTQQIGNSDFLNGNLRFSNGGVAGAQVINEGTLTVAAGGHVVLMGQTVMNEGRITANKGQVVLSAGETISLTEDGNNQISVKVDEASLTALVENKGLIVTNGGQVFLTAHGRELLTQTVVNNSGIIRATSLDEQNGEIVLDGGASGAVVNSGTLDVSGLEAGQTGGKVKLTGQYVGVLNNEEGSADNSKIDARGDAGGGTVLIGGDYQGKDSSEYNGSEFTKATTVLVDANAVIDASAVNTGKGGKVVLWSEDYTNFSGNILARGGQRGAGGVDGTSGDDGGLIETSSKNNLQVTGQADARAYGSAKAGEWLLDPTDVTISTATSVNVNTTNWSFGNNATATINVSTINTALNSGTNVTISTSSGGSGVAGNINVNANISKTSGADTSLSLQANGNINITSATIGSTSNRLNVTLNAPAGVNLNNANITTNNGSLTITSNGTNGQLTTLGSNVLNAGTSAVNITINSTAGGASTPANKFWVKDGSTLNLTGTNNLINITTINNQNRGFVFGAAAGSATGNATFNTDGNTTINATTSGSSASAIAIVGGTITASNGTLTFNGKASDAANAESIGVRGNNTLNGNITFNGLGKGGGRGVMLSSENSVASTDLSLAINNGTTTFNSAYDIHLSDSGSTSTSTFANFSGNGSLVIQSQSNSTTSKAILLSNRVNFNNSLNVTLNAINSSITSNNTIQAKNLTLNGKTGVNVTNVLNVSGTLQLSGGTGAVVANDTANNISGAISVSNGSSATINNTVGTVLGAVNVSGSATVNTSSGNISSTGGAVTAGNLTLTGAAGVTVNGTVNVTGATQLSGGSGDVVLSGTSNNISGAISVTNGSSVSINNSVKTVLGAVNVSGNAEVTTGGNITSNGGAVTAGNLTLTGAVGVTVNGTVTVTGTTQLSGGSGDVVLSGTGNNLAGAISVSNGSSATINNMVDTVLGAVNVSGNVEVTTGGNITSNGGAVTAGNLTLTGAAGVTVNGTVNVTGVTQLNGGTGAIVLKNAANNLSSTISINNASTVSLNNSVNTLLGAVNASGDVSVTSKQNLTLNGNIASSGGNVTLTAGSGVPINADQTNDNVTGGDVIKRAAASVSAGGLGKTVTIYSGNANTSSLATLVTYAGTSQKKAYNTLAGCGTVNTSFALNLFYRVAPKATITGSTIAQTYNGSTIVANSSLAILTDVIDGDTFSYSPTLVASAGGPALVGGGARNAGNYTIDVSSFSTTPFTQLGYTLTKTNGLITIAKADITAVTGITAANKTYDGSTAAVLNTTLANYTGMVFGDSLSVASATGVFLDKHAGDNKTVTISGLTLGGDAAGNYNLTNTAASATANITKANLTIAANNFSRTYDGTTSISNATVSNLSGSPLFGGDTINANGAVYAFTGKNVGVGNKTVTVNNVTIDDGNNGNNYNLTLANNTASTISKADLTVGLAAGYSKTYDGTTSANGARANVTNLSGTVFSGDTIVANAANLSYSDKNVGTGKAITISGVVIDDGNGGANYNLTQQTNLNSSITRANLTVGLAAGFSKTYDGTTSADGARDSVTNLSSTLFDGDTIKVNAATFTDKNAGQANKTVTFSGVTISDDNGGANYNLTVQTNTNSTITKKDITAITGITAANKVYDSTRLATLNTSAAVLAGEVNGDDLIVVSAKGVFVDKNVGVKSVALSDFVLGGTDVGNYNLACTTASATANITKANLTVAAKNVTKTYDGSTTATGAGVDIVSGSNYDTLNTTVAVYAFTGKNVGVGNKAVTVNNVTIEDGNNGNNYNLTLANNTTSTITAANVTVGLASGYTKTYDGTISANGARANVTNLSGTVFGTDAINVSAANLSYLDKNVGTGKAITISGVKIDDGNDGRNYNLTVQTHTNSTITKADITAVTGITAENKPYDGTTTATLLTSGANYSGMVSGDSLSVGSATGTFADKNVGSNKTVTISGLTLRGDAAGNYNLTCTTASTTANITKANLTVAAKNVTKTYDGLMTATGAGVDIVSGTNYDSLITDGAVYAFTNKNAGSNKAVTLSNVTIDDGNKGNNYNLTLADNTTSTITRANLTIAAPNVIKDYDGTTTVASNVSARFTGLKEGDSITDIKLAYNTPEVGMGKTVTVKAARVNDENNGGNYDLSYVDSTNSQIRANEKDQIDEAWMAQNMLPRFALANSPNPGQQQRPMLWVDQRPDLSSSKDVVVALNNTYLNSAEELEALAKPTVEVIKSTEAAAPAEDVKPVHALPLPPELKIQANMLFEFNSVTLNLWEQAEIAGIAARIKQEKPARVLVIGHADQIGTNAANDKISAERSAMVAEALVKNGVPKAILQIEAKGKREPVATGRSKQALQQNRRVEIIF